MPSFGPIEEVQQVRGLLFLLATPYVASAQMEGREEEERLLCPASVEKKDAERN